MSKQVNSQLSLRVKLIRLERDWTLRQMATFCRVDASTIRNIEEDKVNPTDRTLFRITKAFPELQKYSNLELAT